MRDSAIPNFVRRAGILTLGLAVAACGPAEKSPDDKAIVFTIPSSSKAGPSAAVFAGQAFTAMAGPGEKNVGVIEPGQSQNDRLESSDDELEAGRYTDLWFFDLEAKQEIDISMSSGDFDTYLMIATEDGEVLAFNDDDDGTNSRVRATVGPGRLAAFATSYASGGLGSYQISMAGGGSGGLVPGGSVSGSLTSSHGTLQDGSYFEDWPLTAASGDQVTLTLRSSDFDTYLLLLQNGEIIASDDDGAGGTDSQISISLPSSGTYTVRANSYAEGMTGSYTLSLEASAGRGFAGFGTGGDPNGRYALLVGIDDYPGTGSDLRGPVEDARIMERVLIDKYGFDPANVVTLNDSDATRTNIAQGVSQHLGQAGPNGVAVLFYSGHGTQIGENIGVTGSLDPEPRGEGDEAIYIYGHTAESSVILDEELGFLIESIDAGRALVVVDACFSGEITRASGDAPQSKVVDLDDVGGASALPTNFITSELKALDLYDMSLGFGDFNQIAAVFQNPQRHIMWGGSTEDQVSWTSSLGNGASVFAYYVGERMMGAEGSTTFGDVQRQVHDDVVRYIEGNGNMTMQNPQMRGPNQNTTLAEFFRQR